MNETMTASVTTTEAPAKISKPLKKKATSPAKAKTAKKAPVKSIKENIKTGPSKPQLRILVALVKAGRPLSKQQINTKAKVNMNEIAELIGGTINPVSDLVRGKGVKKLVPAGLVRIKEIDVDGAKEKLYEVTTMGKKSIK